MSQAEAQDTSDVQLRPRATTSIHIAIPTDVIDELERVAQYRDMNIDALLKFYIGQGLRQNTAKLFSERVLDLTAEVLTRHGQSQEQVAVILREIRGAATP
ncbi:MAG: hypothetical protein H7Z42_01480 [Roseiflexaceae bacterium]|nr:hypothetical protein [Roseiflexaceae bacterium]